MHPPSVDIIVPVWNNPFETRDCLAAIRTHSPDARLIVVDNGSNRETELMLEEFSEPLDDAALFLKSEKNVGLVRAINMGLALSNSDFAVIIRQHVLVTANWLDELIEAAKYGISTPVYLGNNPTKLPKTAKGISRMETCNISMSALALKRDMREKIGFLDEELDGGEWCLADYAKRAASSGFKVFISSGSKVLAGPATVFGSDERLADIARNSMATYHERWGVKQHFVVYFGRIVDTDKLKDCIEILLKAARHGHCFTLLLHRKQNLLFLKSGWNLLHTSIELITIATFFTKSRIKKQLTELSMKYPESITVEGEYGALKNIVENTASFDEVSLLLPE